MKTPPENSVGNKPPVPFEYEYSDALTTIIEPEAGMVDGESIHSGNVLVQPNHPRPTNLSTGYNSEKDN